jgi:hypothetical protein
MIALRRTAVVSDSFSETLGRLLMGAGNDSSGNRSEREGVPRVGGEFHANPPSDDEYAELDAAVGEMDRTLVLFGAEQEARRMAIRIMVDFWGRRESTKPARLISPDLEGDTAKQPETFHWDEEPFDFLEVKRCLDGQHALVPRQKRPAHRPRNPRVGDRKIQVVETYQQLRTNPDLKVGEIHEHLATMFCIGVSYVKRILREARKVGAL